MDAEGCEWRRRELNPQANCRNQLPAKTLREDSIELSAHLQCSDGATCRYKSLDDIRLRKVINCWNDIQEEVQATIELLVSAAVTTVRADSAGSQSITN